MGNTPSSSVIDPGTMYTATATASIAAARATALTLSPTSSVKGKTFDRFVQIFLENQDFKIAAGDRQFSFPEDRNRQHANRNR
jgi:acid phosphatase